MLRGKILINGRRGSILPLIIITVVLMITIGVAVLGLGFHSRMLAIRSGCEIASRCAADSAIATAIFQMNEKLKVRPWDGSLLPSASGVSLPNCNEKFDYTVSENAGVYTIQGTGRAGASVHSVEGKLRISSVFDYALFARDTLELKNSANVDWINYESCDWPLQVGTNSTNSGAVTLKNSSSVNGDVVVGFGGDPDEVINASSGATITGNTYAMFSNAVLPQVIVPDWLDSMPSSGDIKNTMTISTSGKYNCIDLGNSEILTIDEPVVLYITGNIQLGNGAEIVIGGPADPDNDASLILYLAGDMEAKNGSKLNNLTKDATRFILYGLDSCTDIDLKNGCDFYGAIYARKAVMTLYNSAFTAGSIVGQDICIKNSGDFYYDAALRDRTVNDDAIRFVIHRWSEQ